MEVTNVLIPWYPISYLTIARSGFFGGGAYGSLPDDAIWWSLRTGGGGVLTRMICCVHACTRTKTANLSELTACMNRSIASTLPRTWQDINRSLDPTAASNWRLSIKRYTSESRPSSPPPPLKPAVVFLLNEEIRD